MSEDKDANPEVEQDIHFQPIVHLPKVEMKTLEEEEDEVFKIRAKLFRFDNITDPAEWKERGLGDIRMLKHKKSGKVRLIMRREKTLKICCNHYITSAMKLKPHAGSQRAFVWTTLADFADEDVKQELLAIRFRDAENAQKFKDKFEECQEISASAASEESKENDHPDNISARDISPSVDSKEDEHADKISAREDNSDTSAEVTAKLDSLNLKSEVSATD